MTFIRNVEDFVCEKCGKSVKGNGYTNHCPKCLWSKHVDVEPGDRAASCGALMEPVRIEGASQSYSIVHRCTGCGAEHANKTVAEDDEIALLSVAKSHARS